MTAEVTAVNRYALRDPVAFRAAVTALAARVRDQGHPGVRSYRFFCPAPDLGRAVVTYADPAAWVAHHDLAMTWPEMAALRAASDLEEILIFGPLTAAMRDWVGRIGLSDRLCHQGEAVAGFVR
jgi:hypothetical protein